MLSLRKTIQDAVGVAARHSKARKLSYFSVKEIGYNEFVVLVRMGGDLGKEFSDTQIGDYKFETHFKQCPIRGLKPIVSQNIAIDTRFHRSLIHIKFSKNPFSNKVDVTSSWDYEVKKQIAALADGFN